MIPPMPKETYDKAKNQLEKYVKACPVCNFQQFDIKKELQVGTPVESYEQPVFKCPLEVYVVITCKNCGHCLFFDARKLDIIGNVPMTDYEWMCFLGVEHHPLDFLDTYAKDYKSYEEAAEAWCIEQEQYGMIEDYGFKDVNDATETLIRYLRYKLDDYSVIWSDDDAGEKET